MTEQFTYSFKQAMDAGFDYRDFERVKCLPSGCRLTAIAGVWGSYQDIRCLFESEDGDKYCRTVYHRSNYLIPEIEAYAKEIVAGEVFTPKEPQE